MIRINPKKGAVVSRGLKMIRGTVVAAIAMLAVALAAYRFGLYPDRGFIGKGGLELSWAMPAETVGGKPLTDLAGYTVHCWNAESQETKTILIGDPDITDFQLDHLWPGTYQCAVAAAANDGSQSALSNVVTKAVP